MGEIVAIRRRKVAEEGIKRYFHSTYQILSHFKRDADRKNIYKLSTEENNLSNLLFAATTIHIYHFIGIRTKSDDEMVSRTRSVDAFENAEKREIFSEITKLVGDSINYELDFLKLSLDYEEQILKSMVTGAVLNEKFIYNLTEQIEEHIVESLNKYPIAYWFDHIGDLTGYTEIVKKDILEETAKLKIIGADLEKILVEEGQKDKYLELTSFIQLIEKMKKDFEFSSIRDLKLETFPIKMILNQIINFILNFYPISIRGIKQYLKATELKKKICNELFSANKESKNYIEMEEKLLNEIINELKNQAIEGPNNFVYFFQNLLELNFEETFAVLSRLGISNIPLFCHVQKYDLDAFFTDVKINQLSKISFMKTGKKDSEIQTVEKKLNELKNQKYFISELSSEEIIANPNSIGIEAVKKACQMAQIDFDYYKKLCKKKQIISNVIQKKYPLEGPYTCYSIVYDLPEIYKNLSRQVYYTYLEKICRQIARVLETYIKLKEDKGFYLLGLKRIFHATEEEWVIVNIEELIIQRIMNRQKELSIVFNAENDAYLVNSFILARLLDLPLNAAMEMLKNESSSFYKNASELTLPREMISPVSYVFAYDILNRFKDHQEYLKIKKDQILETEKEKKDLNKKEREKTRKLNTLNGIDKKITSSMISVSALTSNPTKLYWNEKDQKNISDNIKIHSELTSRKVCSECYLDVTNSPCQVHIGKEKDANSIDMFVNFYVFALNRIKLHWPKLKILSIKEMHNNVLKWLNDSMGRRLRKKIGSNEIISILEGERFEIANKIATSIGEYLDKAIYKRFKANLRNIKK